MPTIEQVHNNLKGLLLNGRILLNGSPLTGTELAELLQGEQMLYGLAMETREFKKPPQKKPIQKKDVKEVKQCLDW